MKILFAGTPDNAAETLRALIRSGHDVVCVLTRQDAVTGRKQMLKQSPVALVADELKIPVFKSNKVDSEIVQAIGHTGAELGVVVAYGALLNQTALECLPKGWVNLHFSLLPKWRGAAPAQRAILAGDTTTGVTLFQLDRGLDTGPIWGQVETETQPRENSGDLIKRLTQLGISLLNEKLPQIEAGLIHPVAQESAELPYAAKLSRSDAKLDFTKTALQLERQVLAMNPEPVAHAMAGSEAFRILDAQALGATDWSALDGSVSELGAVTVAAKRVLVQCGQGTLLELKIVQPAGKKPMSAMDWSRGAKVTKLG